MYYDEIYEKLIKMMFLSITLMFVLNLAAQFVFCTNPRLQIIAQLLSIFFGVLVFVLLAWKSRILKPKRRNPFSAKIICDTDSIRITKKRGELIHHFNLNEVDELILKDNYRSNENNNTYWRFLFNKSTDKDKNFLIVKSKGEETRLDFFIDSMYMLGRLESVQQAWLEKGYKLSYITA